MILNWKQVETPDGAWNARLIGQETGVPRVEVRKAVIGRNSRADVVLVVGADGSVMVSQNGRADYSAAEWAARNAAVAEAVAALEALKAEQMFRGLPEGVREAVEAISQDSAR